MPTGYTADIAKGISFKQYALNCARAFGALIEMRDDPKGAKIPDEFKPSDYHLKAIKKAQAELKRLKAIPAKSLLARSVRQNLADQSSRRACIKKNNELRAKYEAMLAKVDQYKSPSREHDEFAKFMREQIVSSIDFDCGNEYHEREIVESRLKSGSEWKKDVLSKLNQDIRYHTKEHEKEVERCANRTAWVKQLFNSLEAQP